MSGESFQRTERYGPATVLCPHCHDEIEVDEGPTRIVEVRHCKGGWMVVDLVEGTSGVSSRD